MHVLPSWCRCLHHFRRTTKSKETILKLPLCWLPLPLGAATFPLHLCYCSIKSHSPSRTNQTTFSSNKLLNHYLRTYSPLIIMHLHIRRHRRLPLLSQSPSATHASGLASVVTKTPPLCTKLTSILAITVPPIVTYCTGQPPSLPSIFSNHDLTIPPCPNSNVCCHSRRRWRLILTFSPPLTPSSFFCGQELCQPQTCFFFATVGSQLLLFHPPAPLCTIPPITITMSLPLIPTKLHHRTTLAAHLHSKQPPKLPPRLPYHLQTIIQSPYPLCTSRFKFLRHGTHTNRQPSSSLPRVALFLGCRRRSRGRDAPLNHPMWVAANPKEPCAPQETIMPSNLSHDVEHKLLHLQIRRRQPSTPTLLRSKLPPPPPRSTSAKPARLSSSTNYRHIQHLQSSPTMSPPFHHAVATSTTLPYTPWLNPYHLRDSLPSTIRHHRQHPPLLPLPTSNNSAFQENHLTTRQWHLSLVNPHTLPPPYPWCYLHCYLPCLKTKQTLPLTAPRQCFEP